mmetsp:Transcript_78185/g.226077  ORF Transcript_78185/g.226077 Transcript_78185/m.226077 type:complete len:274 (+) Transcript_78185:220-1041(+)
MISCTPCFRHSAICTRKDRRRSKLSMLAPPKAAMTLERRSKCARKSPRASAEASPRRRKAPRTALAHNNWYTRWQTRSHASLGDAVAGCKLGSPPTPPPACSKARMLTLLSQALRPLIRLRACGSRFSSPPKQVFTSSKVSCPRWSDDSSLLLMYSCSSACTFSPEGNNCLGTSTTGGDAARSAKPTCTCAASKAVPCGTPTLSEALSPPASRRWSCFGSSFMTRTRNRPPREVEMYGATTRSPAMQARKPLCPGPRAASQSSGYPMSSKMPR